MRRFAFCSNDRRRLLPGTPIVAAAEALYIVSSQFDQNVYSLGIRFILASVTGTQALLWNSEAATAKNENWVIYMIDNTLAYSNPSAGRTDLKSSLVIGHEYSLWIDYDAGDLAWMLYDRTAGTLATGSETVTDYTPSDSVVTVLNNRGLSYPVVAPGTLWDFVYIAGGDTLADMWAGYGVPLYRVTFWFPMREGVGTVCPDLRSRGTYELVTSTGFSWSGEDSDPTKRWQ